MKRTFLLLLAALSWVLPASAWQQAKAKLYTRVEGDSVRAAIQIRIDAGWHLYHTELGGPDAIGKPLTVEFSGAEVEWGPVQTSAPERHDDPDEPDAWTWIHVGKVMVYAVGERAEGASLDGLELALSGLTCTDEGICIPYNETVESLGAGSDRYFADFPAAPAAGEAQGASVPMTELVTRPLLPKPGSGASAAGKSAGEALLPAIPIPMDAQAAGKLFVRSTPDEVRLALVVQIRPGFHLYHGPEDEDMAPVVDGQRGEVPIGEPTRVALPAGFDWRVQFPEPQVHQDGVGSENFGTVPVLVHEGQMIILAKAALAGQDTSALEVSLTGQACDDMGCHQVAFTARSEGAGPQALAASFASLADFSGAATEKGAGAGVAAAAGGTASGTAAGTNSAPVSEGNVQNLGQKSLGSFLLLAVFWGLITLLMPCTYPMIPITISFFTKQAIAREGKVLSLSITYGIGIVLIFILIGVIVGPVIITFATHPVTNLIIGALFIFFSFVLFGAINLQPPAFLMNAAGKASSKGGVAGVFLMGVTLVVTSFTCTAPFVGSLLSFGATGQEDGALLRIVLGMGVFGLTMATPFVLLSLVPGKMQQMPKAGEWMHVLKVFLGFVELGAALKFLSNADVVWEWGMLSREIFLMLWFGIALCAACFLFGWIKLEGEDAERIGPLRMVGGVGTLLFGLYSGMGVIGFQLDDIMTAIIPPYSSERLYSAAGGAQPGAPEHTIIVDDYEAAVAQAKADNKLLLVNFTGHT